MMHNLLDVPGEPIVRALSVLVHASIDGAVAALIVAATSSLLARKTPVLRCRLWWVACCKLLVGVAGVAPLALPILPAAVSRVSTVVTPPVAPLALSATDLVAVPRFPWQGIVIGIWAAGVLVGGAVILRRWLLTRRILRRSESASDPATNELLAELSGAVGLRRIPDLRLSADVSTPQVVGALAPTVLLPSAPSEGLSGNNLAMALCHELVHVRRRDLTLGWVPAIAARLFFFHPGAVVAAREYALAREEACDAEVLRVLGVSPDHYGSFLLAMSVATPGALAPAVGVSSSFLHLRRRLRMLEHAPDRNDHRTTRWAALAFLAAAILIPVRLAARSPHDHAAAVSPSSADAYVLFLDENSVTMSGSMDDLARARSLRGKRGEQFLWFRQSGKEFVVTDPSVLRSVVAVHGVDHEQEAEASQARVDAQQAELEARLEALSRRRDELGDRESKEQIAQAERYAVEAARQRQQAEMNEEIDRVSASIDSLSADQDEIAKEIERVAMEADRRIRELLEMSIESGAAHHVGVKGGVEL